MAVTCIVLKMINFHKIPAKGTLVGSNNSMSLECKLVNPLGVSIP